MERRGFIGEGSPEPIDIEGRYPALLAFHGFGSTPREFDAFAELGRARGLRVKAPLLPGHGTHPDDLRGTRFDTWYQFGEQAFQELALRGPVVVGGLSTGSLIAMKLAATYPELTRGLFVLANALTVTAPYPAWPLRALHLMKLPDFSVPKNSGPDIHDPEARRRHLTYGLQPVRAAADLQHAALLLQPSLHRIRCPVFIAHGRDDHVCPVRNAWRVADSVGTGDVEVVILPRSWHIVTRDYDAPMLHQRLAAFLDRVLRPASGA